MKRDAFTELRTKIDICLNAHPETSGGEISMVEIDPDNGDLLVTGQYRRGEETSQRTHRITITEETDDEALAESIVDEALDS